MEPDTELHRALGRIDGKLDGVALRQDAERDARIVLEKRVTKLEEAQASYGNKLAYWGGALAVLIGLLTTFKAELKALFFQ